MIECRKGVVAEAATIRVATVLSSSDPQDDIIKFIIFVRKKTVLDKKLKICLLESSIFALCHCPIHIFLGLALPDLLFVNLFGFCAHPVIACERKMQRLEAIKHENLKLRDIFLLGIMHVP